MVQEETPSGDSPKEPARKGCLSTSYSLILVRISLVANIAVLIPVCLGLIVFGSSVPVVGSWGPATPARGILLSVYISILVMSIVLLALHSSSCVHVREQPAIENMVAALLSSQILYKITTPGTAGANNPIAISNLCMSALHALTLYSLWKKHTHQAQKEDEITEVKATLSN